jgi:hypothetical protein
VPPRPPFPGPNNLQSFYQAIAPVLCHINRPGIKCQILKHPCTSHLRTYGFGVDFNRTGAQRCGVVKLYRHRASFFTSKILDKPRFGEAYERRKVVCINALVEAGKAETQLLASPNIWM